MRKEDRQSRAGLVLELVSCEQLSNFAKAVSFSLFERVRSNEQGFDYPLLTDLSVPSCSNC